VTALLRFHPDGTIGGLYTEAIELRSLGKLEVTRATDIRFNDEAQEWEVHAIGDDQLLHSDPSREACLLWERENLS